MNVSPAGSAEREALELFHPLIAEWFRVRYRKPTDIQRRAWPSIAAGDHVLLTAPTGTGKTYAAFLYAINQLACGVWKAGTTGILYVSPLKALNNDVRSNLLAPLGELKQFFMEHGADFPDIRVVTRSGDTPSDERRRMLAHPPEIFITTPESLNIVLASPRAREILAGVRTVIIDEIHSVLDEKRGTHLITAVERLTLLAGEFQRIGLSATVKPIETAADFLGGYRVVRHRGDWSYEKRRVFIHAAATSKRLELTIAPPYGEPMSEAGRPDGETVWAQLAATLKEIIRARTSTLIFVNSRQVAERMAHLINEGEPTIIAYAHHGSLSREIRTLVEQRLKNGELRAIVATSSLELGIDIGDLDEVILVQTPFEISQAVQRVGRAGHAVDRTSRGTLFPSHGLDLVRAFVSADMVTTQEIEPTHPILCPLDVLAQIIISMTSVAPWNLDDLFGFLRGGYPYRPLTRRQFDLVVDMLEGKFEESRIRELAARVSIDRVEGSIRARDGARFLLYSSGGTIPDRGYFALHVAGSETKIGELDEEFVWERKVGDAFTLGTQRWRISAIDHQRVTAIPWSGPVNSAPFWRAEGLSRGYHLSEKIGEYLERCEAVLQHGNAGTLPAPAGADPRAVSALRDYLSHQREATGMPLPHRHHVVVERSYGKDGVSYLIIHTMWGGRLNHPLALALSALIRETFTALDVVADNDCVVVILPQELEMESGIGRIDVHELLVRAASVSESGDRTDGGVGTLRSLIESGLEISGFFGARFRENAGRALLLPKTAHGKRMPLWVTRLRAKRLLDRVRRFTDFPIVAETWRTCIVDEFDLRALDGVLQEVRTGAIAVSSCTTPSPSPFASSVVWLSTGSYMYADDGAGTGVTPGGASLSESLMREMVFSPELRVRIPRATAERFTRKLQRTAPGWAPSNTREIVDWLKERLLMPLEEWRELLAVAGAESGKAASEIESEVSGRVAEISLPGGAQAMCAVDERLRVERALAGSFDHLVSFLGQWLQYYGPIEESRLAAFFGVGTAAGAGDAAVDALERTGSGVPALFAAVEALVDERSVIRDRLREGAEEPELCDADNFERLLAFLRKERDPMFAPLPAADLPLFLGVWHGLTGRGGQDGMQAVLETLFGYRARAGLWESELFPARLPAYRRHWLDALLAETDLEWFGCGKGFVSFRLQADLPLFARAEPARAEGSPPRSDDLPLRNQARYSIDDLAAQTKLSSNEVLVRLWDEAWNDRVVCDSFEPVRRGVQSSFGERSVQAVNGTDDAAGGAWSPARVGARRPGRGRWKVQTRVAGTWSLRPPVERGDELEELETAKARARILLDRYGVLFRDILVHETPIMRWSSVFRALRLMELSGEVYSGVFFSDVPGLQFASQSALARLREPMNREQIWWINACDPVSLSGTTLPGHEQWPSRLPSNHIVLIGAAPAMISRRYGLDITFLIPHDHARLREVLRVFHEIASRDVGAPQSIRVQRVNGEPIRNSDYRGAFRESGFTEDFKMFTLRRNPQ